jgi:hypothetical protein
MRLSCTVIFALSMGAMHGSIVASAEIEKLQRIEVTFADIQKRVLEREERSNAVVWIRPFGDESELIHKGRFEIKPVNETKVLVRIYSRGKGVIKGQECELVINNEIKMEMARQEKLYELQLEDQKELDERRAIEINRLSGRKLKQGMQLEEIEKVLGQHYRCLTAQKSITMLYDEYTLVIRDGLESMTKADNKTLPISGPDEVRYEDDKKLDGKP